MQGICIASSPPRIEWETLLAFHDWFTHLWSDSRTKRRLTPSSETCTADADTSKESKRVHLVSCWCSHLSLLLDFVKKSSRKLLILTLTVHDGWIHSSGDWIPTPSFPVPGSHLLFLICETKPENPHTNNTRRKFAKENVENDVSVSRWGEDDGKRRVRSVCVDPRESIRRKDIRRWCSNRSTTTSRSTRCWFLLPPACYWPHLAEIHVLPILMSGSQLTLPFSHCNTRVAKWHEENDILLVFELSHPVGVRMCCMHANIHDACLKRELTMQRIRRYLIQRKNFPFSRPPEWRCIPFQWMFDDISTAVEKGGYRETRSVSNAVNMLANCWTKTGFHHSSRNVTVR